MDLPIPTPTKATLVPLSQTQGEEAIDVHFNPASLVYSLENSTRQVSRDPKRRQFASQFNGKLTMDLQFDTTDTGEDVRNTTNKVALFMESSAQSTKAAKKKGANATAQPVLAFQWGTYVFKGIMESFKETIDYFSADGVPLRALVSIGLARQDHVFDEEQDLAGTDTGTGQVVQTSSDDSATSAATKGGDPSAARALAAANGLENPRFTGGAPLNVGGDGGIQFNAAAGFAASASIGGGLGLSAGLGAGISAGAGIGTSAGFGVSAGISAGAQVSIAGALFGAKASAGVPASKGAFAGLESGRAVVSTTTGLDPLRMLPATVGSDVSVDANASFSLGGAARAQSGLSTDVGSSFSFNERLVFDSD
jgi:hypothetical protein